MSVNIDFPRVFTTTLGLRSSECVDPPWGLPVREGSGGLKGSGPVFRVGSSPFDTEEMPVTPQPRSGLRRG